MKLFRCRKCHEDIADIEVDGGDFTDGLWNGMIFKVKTNRKPMCHSIKKNKTYKHWKPSSRHIYYEMCELFCRLQKDVDCPKCKAKKSVPAWGRLKVNEDLVKLCQYKSLKNPIRMG